MCFLLISSIRKKTGKENIKQFNFSGSPAQDIKYLVAKTTIKFKYFDKKIIFNEANRKQMQYLLMKKMNSWINFGDKIILKNYKSCTDVFPTLA